MNQYFFRIFLPSFEKERRKTLQKEERKTVVGRSGTQKTRSHKQASGFIKAVSAVLLPQLPKALNQAKNGTSIPKMRSVCEHIQVSPSNISFRHSRKEIFGRPLRKLLFLKKASRLMRAFSACLSVLPRPFF